MLLIIIGNALVFLEEYFGINLISIVVVYNKTND